MGIAINILSYKQKFNNILFKLKQSCLENKPHKVAISLTIGACVGIIPLVGVTFIVIIAIGALLRLNQLILQTTMLLVTPLQIILIPIFLKAGQELFHYPVINTILISHEIANANILFVLQQFGSIILCSLAVWFAFTLVSGLILYRILLVILDAKMKDKQV